MQLDIPSLTRFCSLSHCAMQFVNSVCQYTSIALTLPVPFSASRWTRLTATLYRTLFTTRYSTCNRFGDYLYLIDCRRVCYFCFTERPEFFPIPSREAYRFFTSNTQPQNNPRSFCRLFKLAKPPSILSLPVRYCSKGNNRRRRRPRLYDRQAVAQTRAVGGRP